MKINKIRYLLLIFLVFINFLNIKVENFSNQFIFLTSEQNQVSQKEDIIVRIRLKNVETVNIYGLEIKLAFDTDVLNFKGIEPTNIKNLKSSQETYGANIRYPLNKSIIRLIAGEELDFCDIKFSVKSNIIASDTTLTAEITNIKSIKRNEHLFSGISMTSNTLNFNIIKPTLDNLVPSLGTLEPTFRPEITHYTVKVPSDTENLYFDATANNENNDITVNRNKLKKNDLTNIAITVTDEFKNKTIYTITAEPVKEEIVDVGLDENSNIKEIPNKTESKKSQSAEHTKTEINSKAEAVAGLQVDTNSEIKSIKINKNTTKKAVSNKNNSSKRTKSKNSGNTRKRKSNNNANNKIAHEDSENGDNENGDNIDSEEADDNNDDVQFDDEYDIKTANIINNSNKLNIYIAVAIVIIGVSILIVYSKKLKSKK